MCDLTTLNNLAVSGCLYFYGACRIQERSVFATTTLPKHLAPPTGYCLGACTFQSDRSGLPVISGPTNFAQHHFASVLLLLNHIRS